MHVCSVRCAMLCWTLPIQADHLPAKGRGSEDENSRFHVVDWGDRLRIMPPNLLGQEVQVASDKGVITLSVMAQKPYVSGQKKTPVLSVVCQRKGNKTVHAITFSPEIFFLSEQEYSSFGNTTSLVLQMTIGGQKRPTTWEYHNLKSFQATHSFHSFDYFGEN